MAQSRLTPLLTLLVAATLTACGGGSSSKSDSSPAGEGGDAGGSVTDGGDTGSGAGGSAGGGGDTGSGGDTGGQPASSASECLNPALYAQATTVRLEYDISGALTGSSVSEQTTALSVPFEGHSTSRQKGITTTTYAGMPAATTNFEVFYGVDGQHLIQYGSITETSTVVGLITTRSVNTPPDRDGRYTLAAGASETRTVTLSTTVTTPYGSNTERTSGPVTVTFVGREAVSVPAGTFDTCRFEISESGTSTHWLSVGSGIPVKYTGAAENGGTVTMDLRQGTIDGAPI